MSSDHPLPLAPRDLLILATLAEGPAHGYGIIKEVEARSESGVLLDPANLYRVLRRMRREGWIREVGAQGGGDPHSAAHPGGPVGPRRRHAGGREIVLSYETPPASGHGGEVREVGRRPREREAVLSCETSEMPDNRDPRRRVYAITPIGGSLLASELARLERLLAQAKPALAAQEGS